MGVTFSRGRRLIRSKKRPISGCFFRMVSFMLENSALPGTNMGRTHCLVRVGFSQLYSRMPQKDISSSSFSRVSWSLPVSFRSSARVLGLRTPIFSATAACSSVSSRDRPQYSGSYLVSFCMPSFTGMRLVIILPSCKMISRGSSFSMKSGTNPARWSAMFYSPFFHSKTSCFSQAATASTPSPVLALMGKILAFGLRI